MPATPHGKAVSARNATTHGLFARDIVLPSLGEDPEGYRQIEAEFIAQLKPQNLLERHYVEKIAAASWRLRRLHRWQAQLFEDETLTEDERLDKLDKVLRHETHLHRQIDTAVKMLNKDVPQLYARRVRDGVLLDLMLSERECRESVRDETEVDLETRGRLRRIHQATEAACGALSQAPLDTEQNMDAAGAAENCQNEPVPVLSSPFLPREGSALAPGVGSSGPPLAPGVGSSGPPLAPGVGSSGPPLAPGVGPNGLGPNNVGPNNVGPNNVGPNNVGPNNVGPNNVGPNNVGPNGVGPNGVGPNGVGLTADDEEAADWDLDAAQNCQNEPEGEPEGEPGLWTAADRQAFLDSFSRLTLPAPKAAHQTRASAIALP